MYKQKIYDRCLRCNRKLKTTEAKLRGYGDFCWHIHLQELNKSNRTLFDND